MGESSSLPPWLNMIWMSISFITLIGAGIWTFVFFYPYLKQVRAMQFEALKLGRESTKVLEELHGQIKPLVDKIDRNVGRVDELFGKLEEKDVFGKLEEHMGVIRNRIEKDTEPIKRKPRIPVMQNGEQEQS